MGRGLFFRPGTSDSSLHFTLYKWGGHLPKKVHFQNCVNISDGYSNLKIFFVKKLMSPYLLCAVPSTCVDSTLQGGYTYLHS
jgi:hypothetical protein